MTVELEDPGLEIKQLQHCISDLVGLLALPAAWVGAEPASIARTLLEALPGILALDLAFVRLDAHSTDAPVEMAWVAPGLPLPPRAHTVGTMLEVWLGEDPRRWPPAVRARLGGGELSLVPLPIGLQGDLGVLIAGSTREDFPTETERLLLTVAKNQVILALRESHLLGEQKRLTERSEAGFRAIVDTTPECVKVLDREGTLLMVNAAGAAMGGAPSPEAVIGRSFFDFLAPEDRGRYRDFLEHVCAGRRGILEYTIVTLQGERRRMESHAAPLRQQDGSVALLGVSRDVTEQRQAEERLRRSEAFLAEAQRLSLTGSFWWRVATDEITWSDQVFRIFELDPALPVTLQGIEARIHPDDRALFTAIVGDARAGGSDFEYECRLQLPDDSIKYMHVVGHATRDRDTGLEYIGTVQDVSERRRSQEALDQARAELAHVARVTSIGTLTASIAHEVNQPLSGIVTNASTCLRMLAADPPNLEGARETARRTIRDGHRASEVITRLRGLLGGKELACEPVDLNEATREVIALSAGELKRGRVVVRLELADDLPPVAGDRVQLQQVTLNLLLNAAEAMSGIEDRPRQVVVRTRADGGVCLAVEDTGAGFAPEDGERLFRAFYTTKREGMGIGLSVSRAIIERHHGRLWATLNEGPGATFAFTLPVGNGSEAPTDTKV